MGEHSSGDDSAIRAFRWRMARKDGWWRWSAYHPILCCVVSCREASFPERFRGEDSAVT